MTFEWVGVLKSCNVARNAFVSFEIKLRYFVDCTLLGSWDFIVVNNSDCICLLWFNLLVGKLPWASLYYNSCYSTVPFDYLAFHIYVSLVLPQTHFFTPSNPIPFILLLHIPESCSSVWPILSAADLITLINRYRILDIYITSHITFISDLKSIPSTSLGFVCEKDVIILESLLLDSTFVLTYFFEDKHKIWEPIRIREVCLSKFHQAFPTKCDILLWLGKSSVVDRL